MTFLKYFMEFLAFCYCRVLPDDDELTRYNTDDTILPPDFIPVNEAQHQNPFAPIYLPFSSTSYITSIT